MAPQPMINFRYHLASLVAVFLALALGVVMGSTVVDRAIVSGLRSRIDRVESNAEKRKAENDQLRSDLNRIQGSMEAVAPWAVAGRLPGVPVAVVAPRGIDPAPVQQTVTMLQQAGAKAPGILWLEGSWELESRDDVAKVATALNATDRTARALRDQGMALVVGAANGGTPQGITPLVTASVVKFEPVGDAGKNTTIADWGGTGARLLIVDGPNAKITAKDWTVTLARAATAQRVPTELAEVFAKTPDVTERATRLVAAQAAADLATVTTIDDLDLVEGRIAAVLGLSDLGRGVVGRYGYGSSATRSVPEAQRS